MPRVVASMDANVEQQRPKISYPKAMREHGGQHDTIERAVTEPLSNISARVEVDARAHDGERPGATNNWARASKSGHNRSCI